MARARLGLHLEGVDEGLESGGEFGASRREAAVLVLTRAWLPDRASFETLIAGKRPGGCLLFICSRCHIHVGPWRLFETLVVHEVGFYSIHQTKPQLSNHLTHKTLSLKPGVGDQPSSL